MDWQQIFPAYTPIKNDDQFLTISSFGESAADFPDLSHNTVVSINHRGFIQLSGPDSKKFLQGQVTCDLNQLNEHSWDTLKQNRMYSTRCFGTTANHPLLQIYLCQHKHISVGNDFLSSHYLTSVSLA